MPAQERGDTDYVAQAIRKHFVEGKSQQHGKPYRPQPKYNRPEFWQAAAEICIELKADPYSFVRAAFLYCAIPGGPFPNQLYGNAIRRWFEAYKKLNSAADGEDVYAQEVTSIITVTTCRALQLSRLHKRTLQQVFAVEYMMPVHEVPAWVRTLLCPSALVIAKWGRAAYAEIMGNQRLFSILQDKHYNLTFLDQIDAERRGL